MAEPLGTFCLVLHAHLPWLAHHGAWPVGEEWLHQAWASSYHPVLEVLERLAAEGRTDLLTLGVTPVLAAQLDDPYALREHHTWLGFWQARAEGLAARGDPDGLASHEFTASQRALAAFENRGRHGLSPALRRLADVGAVELLGGPATHPFQPIRDPRVTSFALRTGLDDARLRWGTRPAGIWAPECAYRPGLEEIYAANGIEYFLVDGPTLLHARRSTADAWTVGGSDVVAFARDLEVTYRVWSPRKGYPGGRWYRDFHQVDPDSGFRWARVTSQHSSGDQKAPYDPARAATAVTQDAIDFVDVVRRRLQGVSARRDGRPGLVVAAYDTELFGHWWHEGPAWLEAVLRLLPTAGIRVTTLAGARAAGAVAGSVELPAGSWGSGKDWRVWTGPDVADLVRADQDVEADALAGLDKRRAHPLGGTAFTGDTARDPVADQIARQLLLTVASDWAFMVTKDSAAGYARDRADGHRAALRRLLDLRASGRDAPAAREAAAQAERDGPFGHLDARLL